MLFCIRKSNFRFAKTVVKCMKSSPEFVWMNHTTFLYYLVMFSQFNASSIDHSISNFRFAKNSSEVHEKFPVICMNESNNLSILFSNVFAIQCFLNRPINLYFSICENIRGVRPLSFRAFKSMYVFTFWIIQK